MYKKIKFIIKFKTDKTCKRNIPMAILSHFSKILCGFKWVCNTSIVVLVCGAKNKEHNSKRIVIHSKYRHESFM